MTHRGPYHAAQELDWFGEPMPEVSSFWRGYMKNPHVRQCLREAAEGKWTGTTEELAHRMRISPTLLKQWGRKNEHIAYILDVIENAEIVEMIGHLRALASGQDGEEYTYEDGDGKTQKQKRYRNIKAILHWLKARAKDNWHDAPPQRDDIATMAEIPVRVVRLPAKEE